MIDEKLTCPCEIGEIEGCPQDKGCPEMKDETQKCEQEIIPVRLWTPEDYEKEIHRLQEEVKLARGMIVTDGNIDREWTDETLGAAVAIVLNAVYWAKKREAEARAKAFDWAMKELNAHVEMATKLPCKMNDAIANYLRELIKIFENEKERKV